MLAKYLLASRRQAYASPRICIAMYASRMGGTDCLCGVMLCRSPADGQVRAAICPPQALRKKCVSPKLPKTPGNTRKLPETSGVVFPESFGKFWFQCFWAWDSLVPRCSGTSGMLSYCGYCMQGFPNEGTRVILTICLAKANVNIDHRLRHVMASHPPGCVQIGCAYLGTPAKQYLQNGFEVKQNYRKVLVSTPSWLTPSNIPPNVYIYLYIHMYIYIYNYT